MAVGRLRLYQISPSFALATSRIYTTCTLDSAGIPTLTGDVQGFLSSSATLAFKSGRTVPLLGVISYGTPTSSTALSKIRVLSTRSLFYVAVGMIRNGVPTKFFAAVDTRYWRVEQNTGSSSSPNWTTIPYRNRAVRVAPTITASETELRSGRSITYPPTPIQPEPPSPPVTPEPEEEDEEEEDEEEETPVTPAPTGIQGIINSFLQQVLTAVRTAVTNSVNTITTTIPASFSTTVTTLNTAVKSLGDTIEDFAEDAADTVKAGVQTANTGLITALNNGRTALQNAIANAINGVTTAITGGLTAVRTAVTNGLNGVKTSANAGIGRLQTGLVNAFTRLRQTISSGQSTVSTRLSSLRTGITGTLSSRIQTVTDALTQLRTRIQQGYMAIVQTIRETVQALTLKVGELAVDFLGDIYKSGDSLWSWIVSLLSDSRALIAAVSEDMLPGLTDRQKALIRHGLPADSHALSLVASPPAALP